MTFPVSPLEADSHSNWVRDWNFEREHLCYRTGDTPPYQKAVDRIEELSLRLATEEAETIDDLIAQVGWLATEFHEFIGNWASLEHNAVFQNIQKTLLKLRDASEA